MICQHTVFNYVATFNDFETNFARFLDACPDVARFAALGTTEQSAATKFKVDYIKPSGAIGFYYPDWVLVQRTEDGEVNWIVETKGRIWPGTENKDAAVIEWCRAVGEQTGRAWRYVRVNQTAFTKAKATSFARLLASIERGDGSSQAAFAAVE